MNYLIKVISYKYTTNLAFILIPFLLIIKANKRFKKSFEAFLRSSDEVPIDDDDVFEELIQPGQPELQLIAIETGKERSKNFFKINF